MSMCPRGCGHHLAMAERQGISIDYCPQCRGIWLDHGELEKFIELAELGAGRAASPSQPHQVPQELMPPRDPRHDERYRDDRYRDDRYRDDRDRDDRSRRRRDDDDDDDRGGLRSIFDFFT